MRVIHNPDSGGAAHGPGDVEEAIRAALVGTRPDWVTTEGPDDAREAARGWREGLLVVAGGDGTVNKAVNGLGQAGFPEGVTLAVLPSGTGNDLAATLKVPADPAEAAAVIRHGRVRTLDAARLRSRDVAEMFFVNVAVGGAGARVSEVADDEEFKARWGRLSYLRASLEVARTFEANETLLRVDGEERKVRAANLVVGNCRYAGGGWPAAPAANPEDGLLDLVVVEDVGLAGLLSLAPSALARADYEEREGVFLARGREIRIGTRPPGALEFNADGELIGHGPAEFVAVPRALKVIVGSDYTPEPEGWLEEPRHARSRFGGWGTSLLASLGRRARS